MAWVSPSTRTTGTLITAAIWNQDVVANPIALRTHVLLKANSGTDTNAAATNVDTIAISGLTAKDVLVIDFAVASVTQSTVAPRIYNDTDAVTILLLSLSSGDLAAAAKWPGHIRVQQHQSGPTSVGATGFGATTLAATNNAAFTTNWTGAWNMTLRHNGVTAGGTFQWSWKVYQILGQ